MARSGTFDVELRAFVMRLLDRAVPGQTGPARVSSHKSGYARFERGLKSPRRSSTR